MENPTLNELEASLSAQIANQNVAVLIKNLAKVSFDLNAAKAELEALKNPKKAE